MIGVHVWQYQQQRLCHVFWCLLLNIDSFLFSFNNNNGYGLSTKSIPGLLQETSVWHAVTEPLLVPIIILISMVITSLDYFSVVVIFGCRNNRIDENAVMESSLQLVILILGSDSRLKCWHLRTVLSHRMRYGVDKLRLWVGFSNELEFDIDYIIVVFYNPWFAPVVFPSRISNRISSHTLLSRSSLPVYLYEYLCEETFEMITKKWTSKCSHLTFKLLLNLVFWNAIGYEPLRLFDIERIVQLLMW